LGQEFFKAITVAPVPLDTRALRALKRSPLALDLYALLTYQAFVASKKHIERVVTWRELETQFGAEYSDVKDLRKKVAAALRKVQVVLPGLQLHRIDGGFRVLPGSRPAISPR
jgi:hypothetical protein